jgi:hypothetical protein
MSASARKAWHAPHVRGCCEHGRPLACGGAYTCATCGKLVGNCMGAADDYPDDCDGCANAKADEKQRRARATTVSVFGLAITVFVSACGAPFFSSSDDLDAGHHLEARHDVGAPEASDEASRHVGTEGGPDTASHDARVADTPSSPDASAGGHEGGRGGERGPADAGCSPLPSQPITCPYGTTGATSPAQFCFTFGGMGYESATPAACQCAATYTCACLLAAGLDWAALCGSPSYVGSCTDTATGPEVTCP